MRINYEERIPVIRNWLGWESLLLMGTLMYVAKEKYKTTKGLS